jgi:Putative peptidoglycan binding domain
MILQLAAIAALLGGIYEYTKEEPKVQVQKGTSSTGIPIAIAVPVPKSLTPAQAVPSLHIPPPPGTPPSSTSGTLQVSPILITPSGAGPLLVQTVSDAQRALNALGVANPPLVIDGNIGNPTHPVHHTIDALRVFQAAHGLPVSGALDFVTQAALTTAMGTTAATNAAIGQSPLVQAATLQSATATVPILSPQDIQRGLNQAGANPPLTIQSFITPETVAAIHAFQVIHGLPSTGIADPKFKTALDAALQIASQAATNPTASDSVATDSIPGFSNLMSMHGESYDPYARARNMMRMLEHHNYHDNARPLYWCPEDGITDPPGFVNAEELGVKFNETRQKMMREDGSGVEFSSDTDFGYNYVPPSLSAKVAPSAPSVIHPAIAPPAPGRVSPPAPSRIVAPSAPVIRSAVAPPAPTGFIAPPTGYGPVSPPAPPTGYSPVSPPAPPGAAPMPLNYNPNIAAPSALRNPTTGVWSPTNIPPSGLPGVTSYPGQRYPYQQNFPQNWDWRRHHRDPNQILQNQLDNQAQALGGGGAPVAAPPSPYLPQGNDADYQIDQDYDQDPTVQAVAAASATDPSAASGVINVPANQTIDPGVVQAVLDNDASDADAQTGAIDPTSGASQSILDAGADFGYSSGRTGDFRHMAGTFGFGDFGAAAKGKSGKSGKHHRRHPSSPQSQEGGGGGGGEDSGGGMSTMSPYDDDMGAEFGVVSPPPPSNFASIVAAKTAAAAAGVPYQYPGTTTQYPYNGPQGPGTQGSGRHHHRHHHGQYSQSSQASGMVYPPPPSGAQALPPGVTQPASPIVYPPSPDDGNYDDYGGDFGGPARSSLAHTADNLARSRRSIRS